MRLTHYSCTVPGKFKRSGLKFQMYRISGVLRDHNLSHRRWKYFRMIKRSDTFPA
jgi:hypothetical protein